MKFSQLALDKTVTDLKMFNYPRSFLNQSQNLSYHIGTGIIKTATNKTKETNEKGKKISYNYQ